MCRCWTNQRLWRTQLPDLDAGMRGLWCNAGGTRGADAAEVALWHHTLHHSQTLQGCKLTRVEYLQCFDTTLQLPGCNVMVWLPACEIMAIFQQGLP